MSEILARTLMWVGIVAFISFAMYIAGNVWLLIEVLSKKFKQWNDENTHLAIIAQCIVMTLVSLGILGLLGVIAW